MRHEDMTLSDMLVEPSVPCASMYMSLYEMYYTQPKSAFFPVQVATLVECVVRPFVHRVYPFSQFTFTARMCTSVLFFFWFPRHTPPADSC